ncbi:MAG TPA: hypothetical protein VHX36_03945 [Candidatus Acidoferrales bacterium]|jgi:hypothetical protein|nr:hypothetical protein [Candidatus Acidoferrales bacterium]
MGLPPKPAFVFRGSARVVGVALLIFVFGAVVAEPILPRAVAQQQGSPTEEVVANLAAGRVVIAVVKDAILVGTLEDPIEAGCHPPTPVAISTDRVGILLGAVDWLSPSSHQELARLDQELPHLRSHLVTQTPHIAATGGGDEATDIEAVGQGLLERLDQVVPDLHEKLDLLDTEPIAELIVVDYLPGYGPEVWQLSYGIQQEQQDNDYWTTRVLRPGYLQFWPPEKGQPKIPVEFAYPSDSPGPTLIELLRKHDPRLAKVTASDPKMAEVADRFVQGESSKVNLTDATQFLRAALDAIATPNARETMASISEENGFAWILGPPSEPRSSAVQHERPADAPSLAAPQN